MATRLPSGSYRSQVLIGTENGRRVYKSFTADSADAADLAALQYKAAHPRADAGSRSFGKAADEFLRISSKTLSPTTMRSYSSVLRMLKLHYPAFCKTNIRAIDRPLLQKVLNSMAASHAPKTVRNNYGFISSVLRANDIEPPHCSVPQRRKPDLNIPDEETLRRVFDAVRGTELEVPVLLAALVPMREGEICAATIDDLSEDNILHIHRSLAVGENGVMSEKAPKTEASDRYVLLPADLADKIRAQGYICSIGIKRISKHFSKALERAGIEHFRFHDLRHAFVSIAHAAGVPDAYIMARGGWSTSYTVNNVYRHVLDADRRKMESVVNDTLAALL